MHFFTWPAQVVTEVMETGEGPIGPLATADCTGKKPADAWAERSAAVRQPASEGLCVQAELCVIVAEHVGRSHKLGPNRFRTAKEASDVLSSVPRLHVSEDTLPVRPAKKRLPR